MGSRVQLWCLIVALCGIHMMLQLLVFMRGWGLEPKSWIWIIGVGMFVLAFLSVLIRFLIHAVRSSALQEHRR